MRKYLVILLCICTLCALSVTAFASQEDYERYEEEYSIPKPLLEDYESEEAYLAAFTAWFSGFNAFATQKLQEEAAHQASEEQALPAPAETTPTKPIESAGSNNGNRNQTVEDNTPSKYPVGSYVDPTGAVWSPDGTLLSSSSAPGTTLASSQMEDGAFLPDSLDDPDEPAAPEGPDTLAVIAGLVSDIATDDPVWYVEDLRPTDAPVTVLEGLKALVTSIFGEYTPVTTTSIITETVGNDTHQYLVETVAPGAAGVDYEWVAGVFLFGIMLFCFMKLLGGVLK